MTTKIKHFKCGLCKEAKREWMSRRDLREHLREEHLIKHDLTNSGKEKQRWWIEGEIE